MCGLKREITVSVETSKQRVLNLLTVILLRHRVSLFDSSLSIKSRSCTRGNKFENELTSDY
jgi:hypothetical protein